MSECLTCGYPTLRAGAHSEWCWSNDPSQPVLGGTDVIPGLHADHPDYKPSAMHELSARAVSSASPLELGDAGSKKEKK